MENQIVNDNEKRRRPIGIDLFAGAGGMSLGFEMAGFDVVAAVELDPIHCAAHEYNFPNCATVCKSVTDISGLELRETAGLGDMSVDVVFGGSPCQGFSLIGKRALDDPRNELVAHFIRMVVELDANYFVFENVKGLTVGKQTKFLDELVGEFNRQGYSVKLPWRVLNAKNYGVPQSRERLFLIGSKKGMPLPEYAEATCCPAGVGQGVIGRLPLGPSVEDSIGDIPDAESYEELNERDWVEVSLGEPSPYAARLRCEAKDAWGFGYKRKFDNSIITSSMRTNHTEESRRRFSETPFGSTESVSRFFKLPPSGISNTLRAGTASDRGAFTSPRPIHYKYDRCVTVREMARLHGYPDWYRFHSTKWHGARQIGNSVPPPLARAVASEIAKALGVVPMRPTRRLKLSHNELLNMAMAEAAKKYGVAANVIPKRTRGASSESKKVPQKSNNKPEKRKQLVLANV